MVQDLIRNDIINKRIINGDLGKEIELNQIYLLDNLSLLKAIASQSIDLIAIDPPYCTEEDYIEFNDNWSCISGYIGYMRERFLEMHRVLKNTGSFYIFCDEHAKFELKLLLDKIFGKIRFRREIIWNGGSVSGFKTTVNGWVRQHDTILYYTKSKDFTFHKQYQPHTTRYIKQSFRYKDEDGRIYRKRGDKKQYLDESLGRLIGSVWNDIYSFQTRTRAKEYLKYPTQKPEKLLERIILASSNPGDIVADFFCGSGTTLKVALNNERNYIGCDNNPNAIELSKKRLNNGVK